MNVVIDDRRNRVGVYTATICDRCIVGQIEGVISGGTYREERELGTDDFHAD